MSFWQWSSSELLGNAYRGVLAEFIIASALDILDGFRQEWDEYDLETRNGLKIEVKSAAYLQSWEQDRLSAINFGIAPTRDFQSLYGKKFRRSDIYIFCVLVHKDKESVNPIDLSQWDFYILETKVLNKKSLTQQTITFSSLLKLNPIKVNYNGLKKEIQKIDK